jgi:glycerophosphoryl diester phosphodiesterase
MPLTRLPASIGSHTLAENKIAMMALKRASSPLQIHANPDLDRAAFIRPIAHRGLHGTAEEHLENTAPAFRAAMQRNYGIECDLQAAKDGTPMVFHDDKLDRLVEGSGPIADYTPAELAKLRYRGRHEKILTFSQFLELVDGRVPLLVEVKAKDRKPSGGFLEKIAKAARAYDGPIALMSFNRKVVEDLAVRSPKIPRGSIIGSQQVLAGLWTGRGRKRESDAASRLFGNAPQGIAFYAVDVKLVAVARAWLKHNALTLPLFTWTVRSLRQRAAAARWADAPIFEGYEPSPPVGRD